jgi:hypothetical protein
MHKLMFAAAVEAFFGSRNDYMTKGHGGRAASDGHAEQQPTQQSAMEFQDAADTLYMAAAD